MISMTMRTSMMMVMLWMLRQKAQTLHAAALTSLQHIWPKRKPRNPENTVFLSTRLLKQATHRFGSQRDHRCILQFTSRSLGTLRASNAGLVPPCPLLRCPRKTVADGGDERLSARVSNARDLLSRLKKGSVSTSSTSPKPVDTKRLLQTRGWKQDRNVHGHRHGHRSSPKRTLVIIPYGGERKLEGRKVIGIGVTSLHELSSPLVLLISACIIILNLILSHLISSHLLTLSYHISSYRTFSFFILFCYYLISADIILSYLCLSYLSSSYHSLLLLAK